MTACLNYELKMLRNLKALNKYFVGTCVCVKETDRQTDRQSDRQRHRDRQTDRQRQREAERQSDRDKVTETETERDRQRQRQTDRRRIPTRETSPAGDHGGRLPKSLLLSLGRPAG